MREWVDAVWPALTAPALLARLYDDPEFLRRCAGTAFDDAELDAVHRPAPRSLRAIRWTPADAVLLDEIQALLEPVPTWIHVVVDEAQDLSAMQCRAVARRCPLGSVTVLGDLAQATTPWAVGDWPTTLAHLGHDAEVRPLTAGYRVPGEVLEVANRLLPHIAPDVPPGDVGAAGRRRVAPRAGRVGGRRGRPPASPSPVRSASSSPIDAAAEVLAALVAAGIPAESAAASADEDSDPRVMVVPADAAKGLEFDSVVLLEPAGIVAGEPTRLDGLRRLYVVLTRAVSRLRIVHGEPLPPELG